jgi:hypothetical protein
MQKNITIHLETALISPGTLRVDVTVVNVPANLFGAAFHLRIRGGEWSLENFQKGGVFGDGNFAPLVMAEEKMSGAGIKEIVYGMTMKRTEAATAKDDILVSFNLKVEQGAKLNIGLSDVRLVTLGESLTEIPDVKWEEIPVDTDTLAAVQGAGRAIAQVESLVMRETQGTGTRNYEQFLKDDLLSSPGLWDVYLIMAVFVVVSLFVFLFYLLARRLSGRTRE